MDSTASKQLKYFWDKASITQIKAAEYLQISQPAVNQYLNGITKLNTDIIVQFADLLNINPKQIDPDIFTPRQLK
jgi:DNA transposition AAA+ family ATPase